MTAFSQRLTALSQALWPRHLLARIAYTLGESEQRWIKHLLLGLFLRRNAVDLSEAIITDAYDYPSFNAFFTRTLQPGVRPVCSQANSVAAPVDGSVSEFGTLDDTTLLQAKGQPYTLQALLAAAWPRNDHLRNGRYATFYLGQGDYHRVHAPLDSVLLHTTYVPGRLFSVQPHIVQAVPALYARNERLICEFDSPLGRYVLVLIGAGFISGIVTRWDGAQPRSSSRLVSRSFADAPRRYGKGEEIAHFRMGSTVLVLLPSQRVQWHATLAIGQQMRYGTAIGATQPA